jgi:hypothetical protein
VDIPRRLVTKWIAGNGLLETSILLAKSFWRKADSIVACATDEPEAGIFGAAMAAHERIPFVPYEHTSDLPELTRRLKAVGIQRVLLSTNRPTQGDRDAFPSEQNVEVLGTSSIQHRIVTALGAPNIRNIVVTRVPGEDSAEVTASWIAPYLALMRRSLVVTCSSQTATSVEHQITALVSRHDLRPRTVTIVADHNSIGTLTVTDPDNLGGYQICMEPCSRPYDDGAAAFGVGRIPFSRVAESSAMIAAGLARDTILRARPISILMIANPDAAHSALPMAEVVSRITAEEFKNFGIRVEEFYGRPSNGPETVEAATTAHVVIYEGHASNQLLFQHPYETCGLPEGYPEWKNLPFTDAQPVVLPEQSELPENSPDIYEASVYQLPTNEHDSERDFWHDEHFGTAPQTDLRHAGCDRLEGLPLVVLQSCHSLEERVSQRIFDLGGVGVVASATNIHSASGSAFVKAFTDGLLYRGDTVGEALRDARNYFLCLGKLKKQRGHRETAKAYRVALSFRLWGDPELHVFSEGQGSRRKPVSAEIMPLHEVAVSTPKYKLPIRRNEKYFVRMFPGSQVAGIVKALKNKPIRRLMPFCFFRLPFPADLDMGAHRCLQRDGDPPNRAVFLTDPLKRFIYVLYFPEKEVESDAFALRFTE